MWQECIRKEALTGSLTKLWLESKTQNITLEALKPGRSNGATVRRKFSEAALSPPEQFAKNFEPQISHRLNRLTEKSQKQIPHRLKPVRDDKNRGLVTAHLEVRPFKTYRTDFFNDL
ncbi:MAG: hypothetical protein WCC87_19120 [Candidatus Korobacteraceae bacterium]